MAFIFGKSGKSPSGPRRAGPQASAVAHPAASAAGGGPGAAAADVVFEVGARDFETRVIRASLKTPVVVDFWAPWCGPCKQLTPALEEAVRGARGAVLLAKVNIDVNPELAQLFRVQSVPTVYALYGGQPVDGFMGAVPASQLREFIRKLVALVGGDTPDLEQMLAAAEQALAQGQAEQALAHFAQVLEVEPENLKAIAGQLRALIQLGDVDQAEQALGELPDAQRVRGEFDPVRSAIQLSRELAVTTPVPELEARLAAAPDDLQLRFDLASARFAGGRREQALEDLLELIRRDRSWNDEAARKRLLKFLDVMGPADPLTGRARRRLSSLLFS